MKVTINYKNKKIIEELPNSAYLLLIGGLRRRNIDFTTIKENN